MAPTTKSTKSKRTAAKKTRAKKIRRLAKGQRAPEEKHCFDVRDALKIQNAMKAHAAALKVEGLTDAEIKAYAAQITLAKGVEWSVAMVSLDESRQTLRNLLGPYRRAGRLAASSIEGRDRAKLKALQVDTAFPDNDKLLDAYVTDLAPVIKEHSAELARRDFSPEQQGELTTAIANFQKALTTRPDANAIRDEKSQDRENILHKLRTMTSYFRELGHTALRDSPDIVDFNRPKPARKKPSKTT